MRKKKPTSKDKRLLVAKDMPPLFRKIPNEKYSYRKDQVLNWISKRPGLLNYVFDKLVASKYIAFDPETGKWKGVDFYPDDED